MRVKALLFLLFIANMTGCNSQINEFVSGGAKRVSTDTSVEEAGSKPGYKISPGANKVAGSQVKSQFAITPSMRSVKGTQVKSTFSIQARSTQ